MTARDAIEWLDGVPDQWLQQRLKGIFRDDTRSLSIEQLNGLEVHHYSIPNFDDLGAPAIEDGATIASNKTLLHGGEILFSKLNCHKPRVWLVPIDEQIKVASTEFIPLSEWHSGSIDKTYFTFLLGSQVFIEYMTCFQTSVTNSHRRINPNDLWQTPIPLPSLAEQRAIAAYLDRSCAAIDAAIAAKRGQIESLNELAASIVLKAVTQGLDSSCPTTVTGLDWSPSAPAHWQIKQIKRMATLARGQFTHRPRNDPALYDGPYPFIQTGDITAADKYIRSYSQTLNEAGLSVSKMFPSGTLVMSIAANIGDVAILDFDACFPDSMIGMIPHAKTDLHYLYYLMRAMKPIMLRSAVLSTQLNINYVRIGTNFAAFPPYSEQKEIALYLEKKEGELSATKRILAKQIDTLLAYRKSLIHECVTGQRRLASADFTESQSHA